MTEQKKSTLDLIRSAALEEFKKQGYKSASLRNIVKTAGVTTGAFYGYFKSKEQLFSAIVDDSYNFILERYKTSLDGFAMLSEKEQSGKIGDAGRECMSEMLDYAEHKQDEMQLLLCKSEGTKYEMLVEQLIELEIGATHKYYDTLKALGYDYPQIDPRLEHILVTGMMNAFFEMIIHRMPRESAERYLYELNEFYTAGWKKIMGQEN